MTKIFLIVGTRPNFVKAAAIMHAAKNHGIAIDLIHTGQHYDYNMNEVFFKELELDKPKYNLGITTSLDYGAFLNVCTLKCKEIFTEQRPKLVIVVGDVLSSLAGAKAANEMGIKLVHVEAGLRSFDYTMPEELNRILIDSMSDFFFVTEPSGVENLKREGKEKGVHLVGNVMIDTLYRNLSKIKNRKYCNDLNLKEKEYAVVTVHRQSNVDYDLKYLLENIESVGHRVPIIFPVHPRTKVKLSYSGFSNIKLLDPLGYIDFLSLVVDCKFVMTDSGGIQEETTALGIPCLTLRKNTERPITIEKGTNKLVGDNYFTLLNSVEDIISGKIISTIENIWDGKASNRIINIIKTVL